jgi:ubiquinone/menaquinone biosynthesis C-methylase UbiE
MTAAVDTTYEPYSRDPGYVALNRRLVESIDWQGVCDVLDDACGAGVLGAQAWNMLESVGRADEAHLIAADLSAESLALAARRFDMHPSLARARREGRVRLVQSVGDDLPLPDGSVDAVLLGNAIHLFKDKAQLLREVARVLRAGGRFGFNTAFYAGTFVPGTERFYRFWLRAAVRRIRADGRAGAGPALRSRAAAVPAFQSRWLAAGEYAELLASCGFVVRSQQERTLRMSQASLEAVGGYGELAGVLLSGYPTELACSALAGTVGEAMAEARLLDVPRHWLEVVAER